MITPPDGWSSMSGMARDVRRHSPSRLLVSHQIREFLLARLNKANVNLGFSPQEESGKLYFRGRLVVECEQLQEWEYALVRGGVE